MERELTRVELMDFAAAANRNAGSLLRDAQLLVGYPLQSRGITRYHRSRRVGQSDRAVSRRDGKGS
jgi:hypothetical protein